MKKEKKPAVSKQNGEMFETIFGKDMKSDKVEYVEKKENIIKSMLDGGSTPIGLKIIQSVFSYLQSFFTMFVPMGLIFATCLTSRNIVVDLLKILGFSVAGYCVLKIIEFLISALMIHIYSSVLIKASERSKYLQEKIKSHLKMEDAKDGIIEEEKKPEVLNPNDSPLAMAKIVEKVVLRYIMSHGLKSPDKDDEVNFLKRITMTIFFNIYQNGFNNTDVEQIPNTVLAGVENYEVSDKLLSIIKNVIKMSEWFTKPF